MSRGAQEPGRPWEKLRDAHSSMRQHEAQSSRANNRGVETVYVKVASVGFKWITHMP